MKLLSLTEKGLYCEDGDFYIDPHRPVHRALITHAHSDHLTRGSISYLTHRDGESLLKLRTGLGSIIETVNYNETIYINGISISFHPAGHILGSSQIRLEKNGEVVVISGDYKTTSDRTCQPFELIRCNTFITESTFALPIYNWPNESNVFDQIMDWWEKNRSEGITSVISCYALGKAQRVLAGLNDQNGSIGVHEHILPYVKCYEDRGITFPPYTALRESTSMSLKGRGIIITTSQGLSNPWFEKLKPYNLSYASGWMCTSRGRKMRNVSSGFVISDHADWNDLLNTIKGTRAETVYVTHGFTHVLSRYLREISINALEMNDIVAHH